VEVEAVRVNPIRKTLEESEKMKRQCQLEVNNNNNNGQPTPFIQRF